MADTCHILFYKAVEILATRFEYYKRVLNIIKVFSILATRLKHFKCYKRVLNISNVFETLATRFT